MVKGTFSLAKNPGLYKTSVINKYDNVAKIGAFGYFSYCYNNSIFGMFIAICIPMLFGDLTLFEQKIYGSTCFLIGFLSRPFGGILFGFLGDLKGRTFALSLSSTLVILPTVGLAFLPNAEYINSLYLLYMIFFLRFIQGIGLAGSFSNTIVHVAEQSNIKNQFGTTGFMTSAGFFGAAIATLIGFLAAIFLQEEMAWRFSFFLGGIVGYVAYILITKFKDSIKINQEKHSLSSLMNHFKQYRLILFVVFILGGLNLFPIYLSTVYMNYALVNYLGYKTLGVMLNNTIMLALTGLFVLMSVPLLKKFGPFKLLKHTMIFYIVLTVPMYVMAFYFQNSLSFCALQIFLLLGDGPMILSVLYLVPRLFPDNIRCSSVGISFTFGNALIGGCVPLLASYFAYIGGSESSVSLLLLLVSGLFLLMLLFLERCSSYFQAFPNNLYLSG